MTNTPLRFQDAMDRAVIGIVLSINDYMAFGWSFQTALNRVEMESCLKRPAFDKVFSIMGII